MEVRFYSELKNHKYLNKLNILDSLFLIAGIDVIEITRLHDGIMIRIFNIGELPLILEDYSKFEGKEFIQTIKATTTTNLI